MSLGSPACAFPCRLHALVIVEAERVLVASGWLTCVSFLVECFPHLIDLFPALPDVRHGSFVDHGCSLLVLSCILPILSTGFFASPERFLMCMVCDLWLSPTLSMSRLRVARFLFFYLLT